MKSIIFSCAARKVFDIPSSSIRFSRFLSSGYYKGNKFAHNPQQVVQNANQEVWAVMVGFSTFVHRLDLNLVLGDHQPSIIDPLLDQNLIPTGRYALLFPNQTKYQQFYTHLMDNYGNNKYRLQTPGLKLMASWQRSSTHFIDNKTVRLLNVPTSSCHLEHLYYWLEGYNLVSKGIQQLNLNNSKTSSKQLLQKPTAMNGEKAAPIKTTDVTKSKKRQYGDFLVHLASVEEAERLVAEKTTSVIDGREISLFHYQA